MAAMRDTVTEITRDDVGTSGVLSPLLTDPTIEAIAAIVTIVLPLATLSVVLMRSWDRFRCWRLSAAFRRPLRFRHRRERLGIEALIDGSLGDLLPSRRVLLSDRRPRWRRRRWLTAALFREVRRVIDGHDVLPVDVVSSLLANPGLRLPVQGWREIAEPLERMMRAASTTNAQGLLARILYPEDVHASQQITRDVAEHLRRFAAAHVVVPSRMATPEAQAQRLADDGVHSPSFAGFVTALSGAIVLADSVETRSRYLDEVLVWHRRRFLWPGEAASYEHAHTGGHPCRLAARDPIARKIGDFDRRVLSLRSVSVVTSPSVGRVDLVLETDETCYLATEQGDAAVVDGAEEHTATTTAVGCKHLRPRSGPDHRFGLIVDPQADDATDAIVQRHDPDGGTVMLVTSYVSLISADGMLVLGRRTRKVRHGQGVVSATAGGVIEPDGDGPTGDVDRLGMPSPLDAVIRESAEEIGTALPADLPRPVSVFLANARNLGELGVDERAGRGQLVATILYLCRIELDFADIVERLAMADQSLGGFEVDRLEAFVLRPDDGVRATAARFAIGEDPDAPAAWSLAVQARAQADVLDQHGLLSCLYTAAVLDGPEAATRCFAAAFDEQPWWAIPAGVDGAIMPRVVRDPRQLLGTAAAGADIPITPRPLHAYVDQPGWHAAWDAIGTWLETADTAMHTQER